MSSYTTTKSGPLSSGGTGMGFVSYADVVTPSEVTALQQSILSTEYHSHDEATKKLIAKSVADHAYASIQLFLLPGRNSINARPAKQPAPPSEELGKQGFVLAACLSLILSQWLYSHHVVRPAD